MSWPTVPLEKIARVSGGSTPKRGTESYWNGDVPWVTPTDLSPPGSLITDVEDTKDHITEEGLNSCSAPLLEPGTVLFSSRATIGKIGIVRHPVATNQGFANFTPNAGVNSKFLAYTLQYFTPQIAALAGSTTFKEVSRGAIRKFQVPLPTFSEQQRIVEILDQADALRRKRTEADEKAQRILPALFMKMFGNPATNPMGWDQGRLGEVITYVGGATPAKKQKDYWGGNIPWVSPKDMKSDEITCSTDKVTEKALAETPVKLVGSNNILIVVRGMILAHTVPIRMNTIPVTLNQDMKALIPSPDIHPVYLRWVLQSRHSELLRMVSTAAHGTRKIDIDRLSSLEIPLPPLQSQIEFAGRASAVKEILRNEENASEQVDTLHRVLMHRAYSGDLTARWREARADELLREAEEQARMIEEAGARGSGRTGRGRPRRAASC